MRLFHKKEELIGLDARGIYPPDVSELIISNLRECISKNQGRDLEYYIELHGVRYYYQMRMVNVDGDKAFCFIQDISDRVRRMDELLTQRKRAEESDRMKSAFLANMSHEIRTPLNAVVGFSEALMDESMAAEDRQPFLDIIRNNNALLLQIINDILELSRLDAGMSEFHFAETDIAALISEVGSVHARNMKPEVQLITQIPDRAIQVTTDANRVKQVLHNFMTNAMKFTDAGSITLKVEEGSEFLTFSVTDTGRGIPENKLDAIFNRFEKLDQFAQGTGLGLSICSSIAKRLGGKITVTSREGEGSTFSFTIPYRAEAVNIGSSREAFANQHRKVMVIEPVEDDMRNIRGILSKKYELVEVADATKAISAFILDQPKLVLMSMSVDDKQDIISKIHAIAPSIPIIAITTSDFYNDQRWAIENGCADAIVKPFSPSNLEEVVMAFAV